MSVVRELRATAARYPTDPVVRELVEELRGNSDFDRLWERQDVQAAPMLTKTFCHPVVGEVTVGCDSLALSEADQHLVLYSAPVGSRSAEALAYLDAMSTAGTLSAERS